MNLTYLTENEALFSQALAIEDLFCNVDTPGLQQQVLGAAVVNRRFEPVWFELGNYAPEEVWEFSHGTYAHRGFITVVRRNNKGAMAKTFVVNFRTGEVTAA